MNPTNDDSPDWQGTDGRRGAYRIHHDSTSDDSVAETVVRSVAAIRGLDPMAVESPHDQLDTDALNTLFRPRANGRHRTDGYVRFSLNECAVFVYANDLIEIISPEPTAGQRPHGGDIERGG